MLYGSSLPIGREDGKISQVPFNLLSNYESSFHFFLKRAYFFTPLSGTDVRVSDKYKYSNSTVNVAQDEVIDLHPLILNTLNRQLLLNSRLGLPAMANFAGHSANRNSATLSEVRKDVSNRSARHNTLSGLVLETAINLSQANAATPNSSLFYSLRPLTLQTTITNPSLITPTFGRSGRKTRFTRATIRGNSTLPF